MTEEQARALIGRSWGEELAAQDWGDWCPVLREDGTIDDVCPAEMPFGEAAERGWLYNDDADVYRIDWPLADIVVALMARPDGENGGFYEATVAIAKEWLEAGFDDGDVRRWLDAGVCFAEHARRLKAAGFDPDNLPEWGGGWLSDENLGAILYPEEAEEDEEEAPF